jgi:hypothetical protein
MILLFRLPFLLWVLFSFGSVLHARSHRDYTLLIRQAEVAATPQAKKILRTARTMVERKVIIRGSCWNYLNTAFSKAGFSAAKRQIVYRKGKGGPYANIGQIQPGDWLYYINHSYGGIEHSGMFIGWINRARKQGLILSYGGERRNKPGRYRPYDLRSVYQIIRAR